MTPMKWAAITLALAVLGGAGIYRVVTSSEQPSEETVHRPPPPPPRDGGPVIDFVRTLPPGWPLALEVPRAWAEGAKELGDGREWHFGGPRDDGWKPELSFGWKKSSKSLEAWGEFKIESFEDSPFITVLQRGRTMVAGLPALFCIQTYEGKAGRMQRIDFYFAGRGGIGFVRGVATAKTWKKYEPIFREAARRVAYPPQ